MADEFVYLIAVGEYHKIGRTDNPHRRLSQLDKGPEPAKLVHIIPTTDAGWLETAMHRAFMPKRYRGEWFRLTAADVETIRQIARADAIDDLPAVVRQLLPAVEAMPSPARPTSTRPAPAQPPARRVLMRDWGEIGLDEPIEPDDEVMGPRYVDIGGMVATSEVYIVRKEDTPLLREGQKPGWEFLYRPTPVLPADKTVLISVGGLVGLAKTHTPDGDPATIRPLGFDQFPGPITLPADGVRVLGVVTYSGWVPFWGEVFRKARQGSPSPA